jgi:hypothetical protein
MTSTDEKKSIWKRKIKWPRPISWVLHLLFSRKMLRFYLFAAACCLTLVIAFYTIENLRASLAWSGHIEKLKAEGISTDYCDYIPPEIPDEENLAKIPMFAAFEYERLPRKNKRTPWDVGEVQWKDESFGSLNNLSIYYRSKRNRRITQGLEKAEGRWQEAEPTDLQMLQIYYRGTNAVDLDLVQPRHKSILTNKHTNDSWNRATNSFPFPKKPGSPSEDVLIALKNYDYIWEELKSASNQRKQMRFPLHYDELFGCLLPHLSHIKSLHRYGKLRATAELASGRHQEATESIRMMMQINEGLRNETFFISHLVRIADLYFGIHPIWEGIHRHAFEPEDLQLLSSALEDVNFLAELPDLLRMECSVFVATMGTMEKHRYSFYDHFGSGSFNEEQWPGNWTSISYINLAPSGWFKQNMLYYSNELRAIEGLITDVIEMKPNAIRNFESHLNASLKKPVTTYNVLAKQLYLYKNEASFYKTLTAENTVRMVRTAIALERYYLKHQQYPEALGELVPEFLNDIQLNLFSGNTFQYTREKEDRFRLHVSGWTSNRNDNENAPPQTNGELTWQWPLDSSQN